LLARLDRLAPVREVAQIGAAIGREFGYELLAAVSRRSDSDLQSALEQLVEAGLVFRRGTPPTATYLFKHALVQDAAYSTLLRERRQDLHARIGQALEARFPETADHQPEILAFHFAQAGLADHAVGYGQKAGARALERSANVEAIGHFGNAIRLLQSLPETPARDERELALQLALGPALMASRGYGAPEVEATYARAHELCRHLGSHPNVFAALRGLWEYYEIRAQTARGAEIAREVLALAEQSGDRTLRLVAHDVVGDTSLWVADFAASARHTQLGIELYDPQQDRQLALAHGGYDPMMACLSFGAHALWYLGYPDRALQNCRSALSSAHMLEHPPTSALVWGQVALHCYLRDEPEQAGLHADSALALAQQHDFKFWLAHASISKGWALARRGNAEGLQEIRQGIDAYRATGAALEGPLWLAMLADALVVHGRLEDALTVVADALSMSLDSGVRLHLAELYRLRAVALLRPDAAASEAAENDLWLAIETARSQGAKSLELRSASTLVRLLKNLDRRAEALDLLAPIHGWFSEGFESPDLRKSKDLLDRLA
jgi:predicted ATPase